MFTETDLVKEMPNLSKFAMRLTRNQADAEDLVQATLLKALEKSDYFEDGTSLFKWTSKIMFNTFASMYRRKTKFETQYDPQASIDKQSIAATQEDHVDLLTAQELIRRLSSEHQEIIYLTCVHDLRYQEAADHLGIPVGTVRSRLGRARSQLQGYINTPSSVPVTSDARAA